MGFANIYEFTERLESGKPLNFSWEGADYEIRQSKFGYTLNKAGGSPRQFTDINELLNSELTPAGEKLRRLVIRI